MDKTTIYMTRNSKDVGGEYTIGWMGMQIKCLECMTYNDSCNIFSKKTEADLRRS